MAVIKLDLQVDEKQLQQAISKKRKAVIGLDTKEINQKLNAIAKEAKQTDTVSVGQNIKKIFSEIGYTINKKIIPTIKTASAVAFGAIASITAGGTLMLARGLQSSIEKSLPMATALRSMFSNVDKKLYSNFGEIRLALENIAKETGIPFEELAKAVETILPSLPQQSIKNINEIAKVFASLRYIENIEPDTFAVIANIGQLAGKTLEEMGQLYNVLTDNVRANVGQITTEIRKLANDFNGDVETMFASIEYFSKYITIDPREIVSKLTEGIKQYKQFLSGAIPIEQLKEDGQLILQMFNTKEYAEIFEKYLNPGTLQQSFKQLAELPATKLEMFFGKAREAIKSEMFKFAETSMPSLELAYKKINEFATKNFGEFSPILKSVFISPETGMPTLATAVIPIVDKLAGIQNSIDAILGVVSEAKSIYNTSVDFWANVIQKLFFTGGKGAGTNYANYNPLAGYRLP